MASTSAASRTTKELMDALTAHLSLYHAAANPSPAAAAASSSSPRAAILRWLASLSPAARAAAAASLLSPAAAAALLCMVRRLRLRGHSSFFVLHSSSPSTSSARGAEEPTVLSRLSRGLLARAAAGSRPQALLFANILLFPSSPASSRCPDAITVAEAFLADLDGFVAAMDEISGGRFLCCGEGEVDLAALACQDFPELPWLNAKGYYVIEEFLANRLEIALRMSWAAAGGGGVGGRKAVRIGKGVKEKAGLAANAFWREKGYVDWWMRLEPRMRARIMGAFFGKGAIALANEMVEGSDSASRDNFCFCLGEPGSFVADKSCECTRQSLFRKNRASSIDVANILSCSKKPVFAKELKRLKLVEEIVCLKSNITCCGGDAIFFSSLVSAATTAGDVLMKLQGLLMVVSTESINLELIEDGAPKKKDVEKTSGGSRKGKKKSNTLKKLTVSVKPSKDNGCSSSDSRNCRPLPNHCVPSVEGTAAGPPSEKTPNKEIVPTMKEQTVVLDGCKNHCNKKKNKRKGKTKLSNLMRPESPRSTKLKTGVPHSAAEASHEAAEEADVSPHHPSYFHPSKNEISEAVSCSDSSILSNGTKVIATSKGTKLEDTLYSPRVCSSVATELSHSADDAFNVAEQASSYISQSESLVQSSSCLPSRSNDVSSTDLDGSSVDSLVRSAQEKTECDEKHVDNKSEVTKNKVLPNVFFEGKTVGEFPTALNF